MSCHEFSLEKLVSRLGLVLRVYVSCLGLYLVLKKNFCLVWCLDGSVLSRVSVLKI